MPPPPPPPPPPRLLPPAPPPPPSSSHAPQLNITAPDRSALLSEIRGGTSLRKVTTNDRSEPLIKKSQLSKSGNRAGSQNTTTGDQLTLGDVLSRGMPKLRPAGSRAGEGKTIQRPLFDNNVSNAFPQSEVQKTKSNKMPTTKTTFGQNGLDKSSPFNECNSSQAATKPVPPPSNLKPAFLQSSTTGMNFSKSPLLPSQTSTQNHSNLPVATPKQGISTVQNTVRENSVLPSDFKPLPPPKQIQSTIRFGGQLQVKPLPPSKLTAKSWNSNTSTNLAHNINVVKEDGLIKPSQLVSASSLTHDCKGISSSTIPRNFSEPGNLNQLGRSNSSRQPPPIPPTNRVIQSPSRHLPRFQHDRPFPSPQPMLIHNTEPPPLPKSTPPPLPNRPSQTLPRCREKPQGSPPPLPVRGSSKQGNQHAVQDFESRFKQMFHGTQEFPYPHYQITPHKFYMSQAYTQQMKGAPIERQLGNHLLIRKAAEC